ncbi:MAG: hypothetical protein A2340_05270 [Lentisphaerae bacterium RIFOXYB12_FULL_60_10]|nr:MAG: hypothetical protein A2340_05270 [Lentisphaerae bacterium RIFOXYB12_FULL_60_10]
MKIPRFYLDTSVFGGYFEPEFEKATRQLFADLAQNRLVGLLSDTMLRELAKAPRGVADLRDTPGGSWELVYESAEALELAEAYLQADVVSRQFQTDCLHVAIATVCRADALVSWNFRHIVQYHKIRAFNAVNLSQGYGALDIRSPAEVVNYE